MYRMHAFFVEFLLQDDYSEFSYPRRVSWHD